ncbi:MAG: HAD hydrolase family protein, partial [Clostridia bacterium]|nr:HAD hydrolase family protein [Clostridia bacterium]
ARVCENLKSEFDGINPTQNGRCIDITAVGVGKASGIATLAQIMKVDEENIWTAGDNYNDIDMLLKYHGCAMESGVDAAKKAAGCTCNAVADVIKMILNVRR